MKISFLKLKTNDNKLTYSFDKGHTIYTINNDIALRDGIEIPGDDCESLDDIVLSGSSVTCPPIYEASQAQKFKYEERGIDLNNLASELASCEDNTPDTPIKIKIRKNKAEWTISELNEISSIINSAGKYVDISSTDLNHELDQDLLEELLEEELDNWGDCDYILSESNTVETIDLSEASTFTEFCVIENDGEQEVDSNSRNLLRPFGYYFKGNKYIISITFPSNDNFSVAGVFYKCSALQHVHFSGDMLYKVTTVPYITPTEYFLYDGQEGFIRRNDSWITILESEEDFIDKLVNKSGVISYYYFWPDSVDHPIVFWAEGQGPEGARSIPDKVEEEIGNTATSIVHLSLPEDTIIETVNNSESDSEETITPAAVIDYNSDKVEYRDGVMYLDGLYEE